VSDVLRESYGYGDESIRYALLWTVVVGSAWSAVHYWLAARTLRADLELQNSAS
jgi:hypothetical protein